MPSFKDAINGYLKRRLCQALDNLGDAITLVANSPFGSNPPINIPNALGSLICDFPPQNLLPPPPPFTGGQCPTLYTINYSATLRVVNCFDGTVSFTDTVTNGQAGIQGPISGLKLDPRTPGTCGFNSTVAIGVDGNGNPFELPPLAGTSRQDSRAEYSNPQFTLTRSDGLADNCGDPPPEYPAAGDTINIDGDLTYTNNDGIDITAPVTGIFAPIYVAVDASLRVPVTINVGGVSFKGEVTVSPEFNISLQPKGIKSGPGKVDGGGDDGGQPRIPVPEDTEDVDVIVGVLVFSTVESDVNNATGFASVGGPIFHVPRLGSVQFAIKTGNSIGWTSDIDVKNLECYVPCPVPQGAIAVRVTPITGVSRRFSPVRGKPLTSF